jgi:class 3 adenylate cyclase
MAGKRRKHSSPASAQQLSKIISERLDVLDHALRLRQFLPSSFEPTIADAEIVVCLADIRGFTNYCLTLQKAMQDRKIQNFLRRFFRIFVEGLLTWRIGFLDPKCPPVDEDAVKVAPYVVPTAYKNLGDGMMMVWEIPANLETEIQQSITQHILAAIVAMSDRFNFCFRDLSPLEKDSYSEEVLKIGLAFGIAKGHAWRLDFGSSIDYAGSVLNLASRLLDFARPSGRVTQYDISPWLLEKMAKDKMGKIATLTTLRGYPGPVDVFLSNDVDYKQKGIALKPTS